jgi:uncharacterized membrane protein YkoI
MAKTMKIEFADGESTLELLYDEDGDEAFVTVQRKGDHQDDERVAILKPDEALEMAQGLVEFANIRLKRYTEEKEEPGDWD